MRAKVLGVGALLAVGLAAGCATGRSSRSGPDPLAMQEAAPADAAPLLHVNNRNWQDMDVWAVRQGTRLRLGTVSSMGSSDFKVSPALSAGAGDFQLLVAPVGETKGFLTQTILLGAGQTLDLQVEHNLNLTTYSIH